MFRPGALFVAIFFGIIALAALGWSATREELASGSDKNGDWRIVASWRGQYCIQQYEESAEGGACGLAQPGTLNESLSWGVSRGDEARTVVAGAVPPGTHRVEVTPERGEAVDAELSQVFMMTFFVAEVPGVQAIDDIRALDEAGRVVQVHQHTPLPPPDDGPPLGWTNLRVP